MGEKYIINKKTQDGINSRFDIAEEKTELKGKRVKLPELKQREQQNNEEKYT